MLSFMNYLQLDTWYLVLEPSVLIFLRIQTGFVVERAHASISNSFQAPFSLAFGFPPNEGRARKVNVAV
jgi:hypothetical protein